MRHPNFNIPGDTRDSQLQTQHVIEMFGIKLGKITTTAQLPPEKQEPPAPLVSEIHAANNQDFRSGWTKDGLIVEWHKPIPEIPEYVPPKPISNAKTMGAYAVIAVGMVGSEVLTQSMVPVIVAEAAIFTVMGSRVAHAVKARRHRNNHDKMAEQIAAEAEEVGKQFTQQRVIERARDMDHAYKIEDRTYTLHGEAAEQLLRGEVQVPSRSAVIPAATVLAEFQKLEQTPRPDIYTPVGSDSAVKSIVAGHDEDGTAFIDVNPARGLTHLLQVTNAEDSSRVLSQSFEHLGNLYNNQGRIANLGHQADLADGFAVRGNTADHERLQQSYAGETTEFISDFLSIGAAYLSIQPAHHQTAIES